MLICFHCTDVWGACVCVQVLQAQGSSEDWAIANHSHSNHYYQYMPSKLDPLAKPPTPTHTHSTAHHALPRRTFFVPKKGNYSWIDDETDAPVGVELSSVTRRLTFPSTPARPSQWLYWSHRHSQALHYALFNKQIRAQAKAAAEEQGLLKNIKSKKDEEAVLKAIVIQNIDLKGSFAPPVVTDILWVRIVLSPYTLARYGWWQANWYYRIVFNGEDLTPEDCEYLILRNMQWNQARWDCAEEDVKDKMVREIPVHLPVQQSLALAG